RRQDALRARRDLSRRRRAGRAQGHRPLRHLARYRRADDGRAANESEAFERPSGRSRLRMTTPPFELATPARIVFGAGKVGEVCTALRAEGGSRVLVVTGRSGERAARLESQLAAAGITTTRFSVSGEPTIEAARE